MSDVLLEWRDAAGDGDYYRLVMEVVTAPEYGETHRLKLQQRSSLADEWETVGTALTDGAPDLLKDMGVAL